MTSACKLPRIFERWLSLNAPPVIATLRMIAAALLAYGASTLLGLPEVYWAVLSAVIVTRADVVDARQAGLLRASGTRAGCAAGLAAAWARRHGVHEALALLVVLAVLAPLAARDARFRAAPMAAVIVASAARPGSEPVTVALLRLVEIALGIGAGLLAERLLPHRLSLRPDRRQLADLMAAIAAHLRPGGADAAQEEHARAALRRLTLTARAAGEGSPAARWSALAAGCYADARFYARGAREGGPGAPGAQALADAFIALAGRLRAPGEAAAPLPAMPERAASQDDGSPADRLRAQAMLFTLYRLRRHHEAMSALASHISPVGVPA
jgi:uncharacterized membrane protein YccC